MIPRIIEDLVVSSLRSQKKIHLLFGARQAGKTTLITDIKTKLEAEGKRVLLLNCNVLENRQIIDTTSINLLTGISNYDYVFLDEAQTLTNAGLTLKIIHDEFPQVSVLATGSSSFELKNKTVETMTGRYVDFTLYPFSVSEVGKLESWDYRLEQFLLYGFYPEIFLAKDPQEKRQNLGRIVESYLFKDILSFNRVRNSEMIINLTKALAYQLGSEINESELANRLKIDRKTVLSYIDILEKGFVLFRLYPYSRNPRREIGRNYKVYFYDLGVRNSLIDDFNSLEIRRDAGALWENFLILERRKKMSNQGKKIHCYFWRSYGGAEVDYLEEHDGQIFPYEIKWGEEKLGASAKSFTEKYKTAVSLLNRRNYSEFLG
ncbi:MAG: ATP-binding protein [Patescibacteria group bacterium]|nr:ATP-binding protein [Patescibacteria group bacterium]MCL5431863.1 ATP-binding protein [Patescibacteria group bacterium]